jgi:hypothetical protein
MKLFKVISGMLLWLFGMILIYMSLKQLIGGSELFIWLGHFGQGLLAVLVGVALIPGTAVQDFLVRTFNGKS